MDRLFLLSLQSLRDEHRNTDHLRRCRRLQVQFLRGPTAGCSHQRRTIFVDLDFRYDRAVISHNQMNLGLARILKAGAENNLTDTT